MVGSPPRMRGKLILIPCVQPRGRITPADAGKTRGYRPRRRPRQDHPRGCGENKHRKFAHVEQIGSPPRMRGKRTSQVCPSEMRRITPADAGKTAKIAPFNAPNVDHPRGCGENFSMGSSTTASGGSPPRMRGKQRLTLLCEYCIRITPADAGKTRRPA